MSASPAAVRRLTDYRYGRIHYPAADRYLRDALDACGDYCRGEAMIYDALVRPGDTVLDIGANIGIFTVQFGRRVGPAGRVVAFEVQAGLHELLTANVADNGLGAVVETPRMAVGDSDGTLRLQTPQLVDPARAADLNYGSFSLLKAREGNEEIPLRRIDTLAGERAWPRVDFVKIDVEGFETRVIDGMLGTIDAHRRVLSVEADYGVDGFQWMDALFARGYRMVRVSSFILSHPNFKNRPLDGMANANCINVYCFPGEVPAMLQAQWAQPFASREAFVDLHGRALRKD